MVKVLKPGRVVVVTAGRFAGKKAVVVSCADPTKERRFQSCTIAGVERGPRKVHKRMPKAKIERRVRVKAFIKTVNVSHLMATRYTVEKDFDVNSLIPEVTDEETRSDQKKKLAVVLKEKFLNPVQEKTGKVSKDVVFLRQKLHF